MTNNREKGSMKLNIGITADHNKIWKMELSAVFQPEDSTASPENLYEAKVEVKDNKLELSDMLEKADAMFEHALSIQGDRFGA